MVLRPLQKLGGDSPNCVHRWSHESGLHWRSVRQQIGKRKNRGGREAKTLKPITLFIYYYNK